MVIVYICMKIIKLLIGLTLGIGVLSCEIEDTCYDCDTIVINLNDELDCKIIDCEQTTIYSFDLRFYEELSIIQVGCFFLEENEKTVDKWYYLYIEFKK